MIYQPDEITKLEVRLQDETVWLTQMQIATIFNVGRPAVTKHINIFIAAENWISIARVPFWNIWVTTARNVIMSNISTSM